MLRTWPSATGCCRLSLLPQRLEYSVQGWSCIGNGFASAGLGRQKHLQGDPQRRLLAKSLLLIAYQSAIRFCANSYYTIALILPSCCNYHSNFLGCGWASRVQLGDRIRKISKTLKTLPSRRTRTDVEGI